MKRTLAAGVLLTLAACSSNASVKNQARSEAAPTTATTRAVTTSNAHNRGVIAVVGDSNVSFGAAWVVWNLTFGSENSHLNNNYVPVFVARSGSGIRTPDCASVTGCTTNDFWKLKLGTTFSKVQPNAIVTELGINDTLSLGTATTTGYSYYGQKIDWFMKLIPAGTPVFWTNLPCSIEPPSRLKGCNYVNGSLNAAQTRWPNLKVLNWASKANTHPEYMGTGGAADYRVHYTDAGYYAWSSLVRDALDAKFPVPSN